MRQVRIQKRSRVTVALVAVMAASTLLSAFQPASADVLQTGYAHTSSFQQNGFDIGVGLNEKDGGLCVLVNDMQGTEHRACAAGADVDVSDTLDSAWARGTNGWTTSVVHGNGRGAKTTYTYGTISIDVTWTSIGETETNLEPNINTDVWCWLPSIECCYSCRPGVDFSQWREATWSGTITDSAWGTFVIEQAPGYLSQYAV